MGVDWTHEERTTVERGIAAHGIETGRCASLARIVYAVAKPRDHRARGVQILLTQSGTVWLVPKRGNGIPTWGAHTYVETQAHAVDAITGVGGHPAETFLADHWEFSATMRKTEVDPATIDPGIQHLDEDS